MRRPLVAVAGQGDLPDRDPRMALAEALGTALVDAGYRVLCGGRGGVPLAVARGAHQSARYSGGDVIAVLPGLDPAEANPYVDVALPTGLGHTRNALVGRADAVVAIGGGAGTLSELAFAWLHSRFVVAFRVEGWSGRLADSRLDDRVRFPLHPELDRVVGVDTPAEAIDALGRWFERSDNPWKRS